MATRRAPRVRPKAYRQRKAPRVLPAAAQVEAEIRAEFDRLLAIALREIEPLLIFRGARRDAVSLSELWRVLKTTLRPEAILRRLFQQTDRATLRALEGRLPELPIAAVVSRAPQLQQTWLRKNVDLIQVEPRVRRAVEHVLAQPLDRGLRVEEIKAQLAEQFGFESRRAELIARDQTLKLAGELQEARQTQAGIKRYVWTTSADERVRDDHAKLDGQVFTWDNPPIVNASEVARGRPPRREHPGGDFQCLPGRSKIGFTSPVNRAFRRPYNGELTELVAHSSETLECTPNHPILTSAGWQPAERVQVGDYVFKVSDDGSPISKANVENGQPGIADVFQAHALTFGLSRKRGVAAQFHGDGIVDEQIDVVDVQRGLRPDVEASLAEKLRQLRFANSNAPAFCLRQADLVLQTQGLSASRGVGGLRLGLARFLWRISESHDVRARDAAWLHALPLDECLDRCSGDAVAFSESLDRGACDIRLHAFVLRESLRVWRRTIGRASVAAASADRLAEIVFAAGEALADFSPGQALIAKPLRIVQKRRRVFEGHVFNLSTECNWYVAQTLLVHNCRCNADPILDDPPEPEED